eukprot:2049266-Pyramimonas_sp.AAC.1
MPEARALIISTTKGRATATTSDIADKIVAGLKKWHFRCAHHVKNLGTDYTQGGRRRVQAQTGRVCKLRARAGL